MKSIVHATRDYSPMTYCGKDSRRLEASEPSVSDIDFAHIDLRETAHWCIPCGSAILAKKEENARHFTITERKVKNTWSND